MGIHKRSRKGKKAWRRNIDTAEVERNIEQQNDQDRQLQQHMKDADLFFIDKDPEQGNLSKQQFQNKQVTCRNKQTRAHLILQGQKNIRPIHQIGVRKQKQNPLKKTLQKHKNQIKEPHFINNKAQSSQQIEESSDISDYDVWKLEDQVSELNRNKYQKNRIQVPNVKIDPSGASYNPDQEQYQAARAQVIAMEISNLEKKAGKSFDIYNIEQLTKDHQKKIKVSNDNSNKQFSEQDILFEDTQEYLSDSEDDNSWQGENKKGPYEIDRKTRRQRNKEKRLIGNYKELQLQKQIKRQKGDIDSVKSINRQLEDLDRLVQVRMKRREVLRQENAIELPPKLGRTQYMPKGPIINLQNQVCGHLRSMKPYSLLLQDRYNSLEQRGILEPRRRLIAKKKHLVEYISGKGNEVAQEEQIEIQQLQKQNKEYKQQKNIQQNKQINRKRR